MGESREAVGETLRPSRSLPNPTQHPGSFCGEEATPLVTKSQTLTPPEGHHSSVHPLGTWAKQHLVLGLGGRQFPEAIMHIHTAIQIQINNLLPENAETQTWGVLLLVNEEAVSLFSPIPGVEVLGHSPHFPTPKL